MKRMLLFLLFAIAFAEYDETQKVGFVTPEELEDTQLDPMDLQPAYRRRLGYMATKYSGSCESNSNSDGDGFGDSFCDIMEKTHEAEAVNKHAKIALGECEEVQPEIIFLKRDDQSWVYVTDTPEKAFNDMIDFLRDQSSHIDDKMDLLLTYTYKTRDGKSRTLIVQNDMDLWSAIQLQEKFPVTELGVMVDTTAPSGQPTTGHPSVSPTKSQSPSKAPTSSISTKIMTEESIVWLNSILKTRKSYKVGTLLYRMSQHGKAASYFHKYVSGKGKHVCIVKRSKVSNYQLFGSYSDISWASSGSYGYCNGCFLWIWNDGKYQKYVSTIRRYAQYGVYRTSGYGPCFGGGHDYCINSPSTPYGYTSQGHTWKAPNGGYPYYYGGTSRFDIEDWECFTTVSASGR